MGAEMRVSKWLYGASAVTAFAALAATSGPANADFVINDDLIVIGSTCTGFDCVNGEAFNFDTLILKENNLRIFFNDTSTLAGFPSNDWRIQANDSASGGGNFLAIVDAGTTGGGTAQVFRVDAGAGANALRVDSQGDVGIGTAVPVVELHVADGDTPTLRLEQNSSSGFTAQTWDVAGNEVNFFVRDVTNGSRLPFRIRPNAPTSSLDIAASGNVGVGTASPGSAVHVRRTDGSSMVHVEEASTTTTNRTLLQVTNNGNPSIDMINSSSGTIWQLAGRNAFLLRHVTSGLTVMTTTSTGNLTIPGTITTGGPTCGGGCDAVFSPDYELPSIAEHAALMQALGHLPEVGPTGPHHPMNVTEKLGGMLNELEKAHIYIADLERRVVELETPRQE